MPVTINSCFQLHLSMVALSSYDCIAAISALVSIKVSDVGRLRMTIVNGKKWCSCHIASERSTAKN